MSIVIPLKCSVKTYHWGKKGINSVVANIGLQSKSISKLEDDTSYAELWMGTHPSGPSLVVSETDGITPLAEVLKETPEYSGSVSLIEKYGPDLPFLFKVLSINEPLSIQSHPDKKLAQQLHAKDPSNYPDANHKPEMAIAITPMELLCSFKPHESIIQNLRSHEELTTIIGSETLSNYTGASDEESRKTCLKRCFEAVLTLSDVDISNVINSLKAKFLQSDFTHNEDTKLFLRVLEKYPQDIGCLCLFFLNFLELQPYQAIFLAANEPHCYITGDCIECMAKSDNVIRAGFTPKYKDKLTLLSSLTYLSVPKSHLLLQPLKINEYISQYSPPVEEFAVDKIQMDDVEIGSELVLDSKSSGSILILISGTLKIQKMNVVLSCGSVHFIPALLTVNLVNGTSHVLGFRSYVNF